MGHNRRENKFISALKEHIKVNYRIYLVVFVIFIIGIVIGMMFLHNLNETQKNEVGKYLNNSIITLKDNNEIDTLELLRNSIKNNVILCITIWFVGSTVVGLPFVYAILAFKGFSFGYTVSAIIAILRWNKRHSFYYYFNGATKYNSYTVYSWFNC